jgi:hypothetical protein
MSLLTNTQWRIHANNYDGDLIFNEDQKGNITGTVFGQPLENIQLIGNSISFTRVIDPNYKQIYSGTAVGQGQTDWGWMMMGLFTELKGGQIGMPYMWSTDTLIIPG